MIADLHYRPEQKLFQCIMASIGWSLFCITAYFIWYIIQRRYDHKEFMKRRKAKGVDRGNSSSEGAARNTPGPFFLPRLPPSGSQTPLSPSAAGFNFEPRMMASPYANHWTGSSRAGTSYGSASEGKAGPADAPGAPGPSIR